MGVKVSSRKSWLATNEVEVDGRNQNPLRTADITSRQSYRFGCQACAENGCGGVNVGGAFGVSVTGPTGGREEPAPLPGGAPLFLAASIGSVSALDALM